MELNWIIIREWKLMELNEMYLSKGKEWNGNKKPWLDVLK